MIKYVNVCVEPDVFMAKLRDKSKSKKNTEDKRQLIDFKIKVNIASLLLMPLLIALNIATSLQAYDKISWLTWGIILYCVWSMLTDIMNIVKARRVIKVMDEEAAVMNDAFKDMEFRDVVLTDKFKGISDLTRLLWIVYGFSVLSMTFADDVLLVTYWTQDGVCTEGFSDVIDKGCENPNSVSITNDAIFIGEYEDVLSHAIKSLVLSESDL